MTNTEPQAVTLQDLLRLRAERKAATKASLAAEDARIQAIHQENGRRMSTQRIRDACDATRRAEELADAAREAFSAAKRAASPEVVAELNRLVAAEMGEE